MEFELLSRNHKLKLSQIILFCVLLGGLSSERVCCYETHSIPSQWVSLNNIVDIEQDSISSPDGGNSIQFSLTNRTGRMNFGFVFEESVNLSSGEFLVFWIRIQNIAEEHLYYLILDDVEGKRRAFSDLVRWFDLQPMKWARLVVDPSTFWWEDDGFDPARVTRVRFVFSAVGESYSEVVWLADLILFEPDKAVDEQNSESRNLSLIWGILLTISLAVVAGFVTLRLFGAQFGVEINHMVMVPVYGSFGLSSIVLVSMVLTFLRFDHFTVIGFIISLATIFGLLCVKRMKRCSLSVSFRSWRTASFLVPMILLGFSFLRFTYLASSLGWAPLHDPQIHGKYISLILHYGRIPSSTYPIGNLSLSPVEYPMGFHVLGALVVMITNLYPGEAMLAVSVAVVAFLPSLLFSTVYIGTRSLKLSLLAYLLAYFLPGGQAPYWRASHDLLLGTFLAGVYPNLLGNLIFLTLFPLILGLDQTDDAGFKRFVTYATLILSLAVVYYPLLPYALLFCLLIVLKGRLTYSQMSLLRILETITVLAVLAATYFYVNWNRADIFEALNVEIWFPYVVYMRYPLFMPSSPYVVYTVFLFSGLVLSFCLHFDKKTAGTAIMFWILFSLMMVSQNESIYTNYLWFTRPGRALILAVVASYVVILLSVSKIHKGRIRNTLKLQTTESRVLLSILRVQVLFAIVLLFTPSIAAHVSFSYRANLQTELPHGNDLAAMEWLSENADSHDLILNFPMSTAWLPSVGTMNIVNELEILKYVYLYRSINGTWLANRTVECNEVISRPHDYELVRKMADKYDLKYVYIGEANPRAAIYARGIRISPVLASIPLGQEQRLAMYMLNPYLEVVYRAGNAVVFRVKQN